LAVRQGEVKHYAEIARQMGLSRARVAQVCCLTLLAPSIQEAFVANMENSLAERALRSLLDDAEWSRQEDHFGQTKTDE